MRRRTYLTALAVGVTATAGCGAIEGQDEEPGTPTSTPETTPTPAGDPDVRIVDAYPGQQEFESGDVVDLAVELRNAGGNGSVPLQVALGNETVVERSVQVENGRHLEEIELTDVADGYHEFTVTVGNQTATGTFTVGTPVERPRVVKPHTVLATTEKSTSRAKRLDVDVEVPGDPATRVAPPGRQELLDICRKLILEALDETNWNVLRFRIWRKSQTVGDEAAHATVTWGPNGNWSGVGTGADRDYSNHQFDVTGAPYLVTDGARALQAGRWTYTVAFDVENQGVEREAISGAIRTNRTDVHSFEVDLASGQRTTVRYEIRYPGRRRNGTYTITADGSDRLYGQTSGELQFS